MFEYVLALKTTLVLLMTSNPSNVKRLCLQYWVGHGATGGMVLYWWGFWFEVCTKRSTLKDFEMKWKLNWHNYLNTTIYNTTTSSLLVCTHQDVPLNWSSWSLPRHFILLSGYLIPNKSLLCILKLTRWTKTTKKSKSTFCNHGNIMVK